MMANARASISQRSDAAYSFNPQEPSPMRSQDRGKFVSRYTKRPLVSEELELRVAALEKTFGDLKAQLAKIFSSYQWSSVSLEVFQRYNLTDLAVQYKTLEGTLYGVDGLVEYAACAHADMRMAIIARIHKVALGIMLGLVRVDELIAAKRDPHTVSAYRRLQVELPGMFTINSVEKLDQFLQCIDAMIEEYNESSSPLAKRLLEISCYVLEKQGPWHVQRGQKITERKTKLAHLAIREGFEVSMPPDSLLKYAQQEYDYWEHSPAGSKMYYNLPYWGAYPQTGALGESITAQIGKPLSGLIERLRQILDGYAEGGSFVQLDEYKAALEALEKLYQDRLEKVCTTPPDALTVSLVYYVIGLDHALKEARLYFTLCQECQNYAFFEAQTAFRRLDSRNMNSLFSVLQKMKQAKDESLRETPLDRFVGNATELLYDVHAQQAVELLRLTDQELEVPRLVFSHIATEHLERYVTKRILQLLFLPNHDVDIELELVLHLAERNLSPRFTGGELYRAYTTKTLAQDVREKAVKMISKILLADGRDANLLAYLRAWQKFLEDFHRAENSLYQTLYDALDSANQKHHYGAIYDEVQKSGLDSWHVDDPRIFLQELHSTVTSVGCTIPGVTDKIKTQNLFQSIFLRTMAAVLYAKNCDEQILAERMKHALLTKYDAFTVGREFDSALLESALQAILRTPSRKPLLSDREQGLVAGAIDTYLQHGGSKQVELALFALQEVDPDLKERCIQAMGEMEFNRLQEAILSLKLLVSFR